MRLKGWITLTLMALLAIAFLGWSLAGPKARKTVAPSRDDLDPDRETGLILRGTLIPMITIPIAVHDLKLMVSLNTPVHQGQVIGVAPVQIAPAQIERAQSEWASADASVVQAEERVREGNEELATRQIQAGNMSTQEIKAETGELDAEGKFARYDTLFRSGLASELDLDAAAAARASADAALSSLRSEMAAGQAEIDGWDARAAEDQSNLAAATKRRNAAQALAGLGQRAGETAPVLSPAEGMIVVSQDPIGTSVGIACDPGRLYAYAELKQADLTSIRIGQQALIVLDGNPAVTLHAKVAAISESPVDAREGAAYPVALSVENPARTWLSGVTVHVLIEPPSR